MSAATSIDSILSQNQIKNRWNDVPASDGDN